MSNNNLSPVKSKVCDDPSLAQADVMVAQLYQSVLAFRGTEGHEGHWPGEVISNQLDWIEHRNSLTEKADLLEAYVERIQILANALKNRWQ